MVASGALRQEQCSDVLLRKRWPDNLDLWWRPVVHRSPRAGVDCVGHTTRAATDDNPRVTVLSVDGVGAYDHVLRATMLSKLREVPGLQSLLPFVRQAYSSPSSYTWEGEEGQRNTIEQHEGGEQGDLHALAIHNALKDVQGHLESGELLFAFLDDVYVVCLPHRVRSIFNLLGDRLSTMVGIRFHEGKTLVWNNVGECPEEIAGTPVGSGEFVAWDALPWVPECTWQVLVQCTGPKCHHFLRTLPPSKTGEYADGHDLGMMQAMVSLLGGLTGEVSPRLCPVLSSSVAQQDQVEPEAFRTLVFRETPPASLHNRYHLQMWSLSRPLGKTPSNVPSVGQVTHQSSANGEDSGESVSRSRCACPRERQIEGHECRGPGR